MEANEVFARLPRSVIAALRDDGFVFYDWGPPECGEIRLVPAFDTAEEDAEAFLAAAARRSREAGAAP